MKALQKSSSKYVNKKFKKVDATLKKLEEERLKWKAVKQTLQDEVDAAKAELDEDERVLRFLEFLSEWDLDDNQKYIISSEAVEKNLPFGTDNEKVNAFKKYFKVGQVEVKVNVSGDLLGDKGEDTEFEVDDVEIEDDDYEYIFLTDEEEGDDEPTVEFFFGENGLTLDDLDVYDYEVGDSQIDGHKKVTMTYIRLKQ